MANQSTIAEPRHSTESTLQTPSRRIFTLKAFAERHSTFLTLAALTNQVFKAAPRHSSLGAITGNGMNDHGAIVRLGGRVLIDEDCYFAWVDSLQKVAA